jgi:hypothetical protein
MAVFILCGLLIIAVTIHAMVTANQQRLENVLSVAWRMVVGLTAWAIATQHWQSAKAGARRILHALKE